MLYEVITVKSFLSQKTLTYSSNLVLKKGQLVLVPFGKSTSLAVVVKKSPPVNFKTKEILSILPLTPLPSHLLDAIFWLSDYYLTPLSKNLSLILPDLKNSNTTPIPDISPQKFTPPNLNPHQTKALNQLFEINTNTRLLHGITGSGKTNIYLNLTASTLLNQKSTIILVPEIGLTSQLVDVFKQTFGDLITVIHSQKTKKARREIWHKLNSSTTPQIIIGPRSALFAPLHNLGLIIIDEAHEQSYYQENPPRYSTLRLASYIAKTLNIPCIFGSATPNLLDFYLAQKNHSLVSLTKKAIPTKTITKTTIIDLKDSQNFTKNRYFSDLLLEKISFNLKNHYQTLIFHNRRGSSPITVCESCGHQLLCPNCFLPLTLHTDRFALFCHACNYSSNIPLTCPSCQKSGSLIHKGFGTKLLESELKNLFQNAKIARFDADNTKTTSLTSRYEEIKTGEIDIIIGTQSIVKGFDFPNLATVGIVQADSGLSLPDYSAPERTFQLISQAIGRIGRGHLEQANAIIQTYQPSHPAITFALSQDFTQFSKYALNNLSLGKFPPFYYLAKITISYKTENSTLKHAKSLFNLLSKNPNLLLSPPTPSFHERKKDVFTWQLILKSRSRNHLIDALKSLPKNPNYHFFIDPPSLL